LRTAHKQYPLSNFFIITTKQERYVRAILSSTRAEALPCPAPAFIYDLENPYGPKSNVLEALLKKYPDSTIHFVEDRYETLVKIASIPALDAVKLYLVDWGYNTVEQREDAKQSKRIELIGEIICFLYTC
jgi:hypothetical protein